MKFRTECEIARSRIQLDADLPIVSVGSCFAANITGKLRECLVNAVNPLGVQFNPLSIGKVVELCMERGKPTTFENSLFESDGIIHSNLFDSTFSSSTSKETSDRIKKASHEFFECLNLSKTLIVTLGTAFCYFLSQRPDIAVSNCHKQPSSNFMRRLLSVEECVSALNSMMSVVRKEIADCKFIYTVSPVIHLRDGLHANNISKSTLILAVDRICAENEFCEYFAAYELIRDDLRDYRFYASDLCHPSQTAIDYVWEKFVNSHFEESQQKSLQDGLNLYRRLTHKPIIKEGAAYHKFIEDTRRLKKDFYDRHPGRLKITIV